MFGPPGRGNRVARLLFLPLVALLAALVLLFHVYFESTFVDGASMKPTLHHGDRVLVSPQPDKVDVGDVVVVSARPQGGGPERGFIKRVIGVGGDTVRVEYGVAFVNGAIESGPYTPLTLSDYLVAPSVTVPDRHVYTLGDNRVVSYDSRMYGPVPIDRITGKVVAVWAPIQRVGLVR